LKSHKNKSFWSSLRLSISASVLTIAGLAPQAQAQSDIWIQPFFMPAGQSYTSGNLTLAMQTDGNFVLYKAGVGPVWDAQTGGTSCTGATCAATLQMDGNLVIYRQGFVPNNTATTGQNSMILSDEAPFITLNNGQSTVWSGSNTFRNLRIYSGDAMKIHNSDMVLAMQTDGNLVLYKSGIPVWATGTSRRCGLKGCSVHFQQDGNLVLYYRNYPYAHLNTFGQGLVLRILNVAPYVVINTSNGVAWPRRIPATCNYLTSSPQMSQCHDISLL
jgi:hypothetical protein